jgi:hypothetical protein
VAAEWRHLGDQSDALGWQACAAASAPGGTETEVAEKASFDLCCEREPREPEQPGQKPEQREAERPDSILSVLTSLQILGYAFLEIVQALLKSTIILDRV